MTTAIHTDVAIRWTIRRDIERLLQIERQAFEIAWTEADFLNVLRQRNCIGLVAEHEDRILGYVIYELHSNYLKVLNFGVAPAHHREGIGTAIVDKLKSKLSQQRRERIVLEVRETNLAAQLFFKEQKFFCTGILNDFYPNGEPAYCFEHAIVLDCEEAFFDPRRVNRVSGYL